MASGYKALRVPIAILHQKVYPTGRRLARWEAFEVEKEEEPLAVIVRAVSANPLDPLFTRMPYLRRFFTTVDGKERAACRLCGEEAESAEERSVHINKCYAMTSRILNQLIEIGKCAICESLLPERVVVSTRYDGIAVCSPDCLEQWDWWNPVSFEEAFEGLKKRMKNKGHESES